jgi:DNA-binding HxlR family transcriptional regulator
MTPSEIRQAAQAIAPRIQLRDVWFILRQMHRRGLIHCLNPKELTGKVYYWSPATNSPTPNWHSYAFVIRAKIRRLVLLHLAHRADLPATHIRRAVNERHPVSLNTIIRALRDLRTRKLISVVGEGDKRGQKLYRVTADGRHIAEMLSHRTESTQSLLTLSPVSSA